MGESIKDLLLGREVVDVADLPEGFVVLFDDGVILHVTNDDVSFTTGTGWYATWEELTS